MTDIPPPRHRMWRDAEQSRHFAGGGSGVFAVANTNVAAAKRPSRHIRFAARRNNAEGGYFAGANLSPQSGERRRPAGQRATKWTLGPRVVAAEI